jgi:hypothetical protein
MGLREAKWSDGVTPAVSLASCRHFKFISLRVAGILQAF